MVAAHQEQTYNQLDETGAEAMRMGPLNWLKGLAGKKEFDCQDVHENCSDYVDEEMPAQMTQKFKAHVDDCPDCDKFVKTFTATVMTARDLPRRAASPDLRQRIQDRISGERNGN